MGEGNLEKSDNFPIKPWSPFPADALNDTCSVFNWKNLFCGFALPRKTHFHAQNPLEIFPFIGFESIFKINFDFSFIPMEHNKMLH